MGMLRYQEMSVWECMEVLRAAHAVRLAVFDGQSPYLVPMGFEWFSQGWQPVICLMMPSHGRKAEALRRCPHVCLEWEWPRVSGIEVVLGEGEAECVEEEDEKVIYAVALEEMSGRRYFAPEE